LSSALDRQVAAKKIQPLALSIAAKNKVRMDEDEEEDDDSSSSSSDDKKKKKKEVLTCPILTEGDPLEFTPEEEEVIVCMKEAKGKDASKSPKHWMKFANKPQLMTKVVKSVGKTGQISAFVDKLVDHLASKALACQSRSSLMDLVQNPESPLKPLVEFSKAALTAMEQTDAKTEQTYAEWVAFNQKLLTYTNSLFKVDEELDKAVAEIVRKTVTDVKAIEIEKDLLVGLDYDVLDESGKHFYIKNDRGVSSTKFYAAINNHKAAMLWAASGKAKDEITAKVHDMVQEFRRGHTAKIESLNPPEKCLKILLADLQLQPLATATFPVSGSSPEFRESTVMGEQTMWEWIWNTPASDVQGHKISKSQVIGNMKNHMDKGYEAMIKPYRKLLAKEAKKIAKEFTTSVQKIITEANEQFDRVKHMKSRPSFTLAKNASKGIVDKLTESSIDAQELLDLVEDDQRFKP